MILSSNMAKNSLSVVQQDRAGTLGMCLIKMTQEVYSFYFILGVAKEYLVTPLPYP